MTDLIERAMEAQSRQRDTPPEQPQWSKELHECWKALREQLERRVAAAGRQ